MTEPTDPMEPDEPTDPEKEFQKKLAKEFLQGNLEKAREMLAAKRAKRSSKLASMMSDGDNVPLSAYERYFPLLITIIVISGLVGSVIGLFAASSTWSAVLTFLGTIVWLFCTILPLLALNSILQRLRVCMAKLGKL